MVTMPGAPRANFLQGKAMINSKRSYLVSSIYTINNDGNYIFRSSVFNCAGFGIFERVDEDLINQWKAAIMTETGAQTVLINNFVRIKRAKP